MEREILKDPKSKQVEKIVPAPSPTTTPTQPQEKSKGMSKGLLAIIIILVILSISITGYIVYTEFLNKPIDDTDITQEEDSGTENNIEVLEELGDDDDDEVVVEEDTSTEFEGEVLSATLPEGWTIIEYFDGEGTESLTDFNDYIGLTAFDIINPDSEQVFTIQGVSGIGFPGCPEYSLFDDNGEAYMSEQESASEVMGEELNVVDYTGQDYIEFEFLNTTFRRMGKKYFYDTQEGNNYFEPPCVDGLLTLEGLYFEDTDGYTYEAYFYGATEISTETDLLVVDEILESMGV